MMSLEKSTTGTDFKCLDGLSCPCDMQCLLDSCTSIRDTTTRIGDYSIVEFSQLVDGIEWFYHSLSTFTVDFHRLATNRFALKGLVFADLADVLRTSPGSSADCSMVGSYLGNLCSSVSVRKWSLQHSVLYAKVLIVVLLLEGCFADIMDIVDAVSMFEKSVQAAVQCYEDHDAKFYDGRSGNSRGKRVYLEMLRFSHQAEVLFRWGKFVSFVSSKTEFSVCSCVSSTLDCCDSFCYEAESH